MTATYWKITGAVFILLGAVYVWGFQAMLAIKYRRIATKTPVLWKTPQPLKNVTASRGETRKLTQAGFEFEVPWGDL
ncbi:MAG TPA: hypothetical protein VEI73_16080 [Candidatus Acidoferrum sp.]|nr:hypothetical protein [Candidatus Acidoferrum sp.]